MFGFFTHSFISLIHPVHQDLSRASTYQAPAGHWIIAQGHRHGPALGLLIEKADGHQEGREGTWNLGAGEGSCGTWDLGENQGVERVCPRSVHIRAVTVTCPSTDISSPCKLFTSDLEVYATRQSHTEGARGARA